MTVKEETVRDHHRPSDSGIIEWNAVLLMRLTITSSNAPAGGGPGASKSQLLDRLDPERASIQNVRILLAQQNPQTKCGRGTIFINTSG
jgi:hypothetical protein